MLNFSKVNTGRQQEVFDYGEYQLSVISTGYGSEDGLYEIGVFKNGAMTELPGITWPGDQVKGSLTAAEVDAIMLKMYSITQKEPELV